MKKYTCLLIILIAVSLFAIPQTIQYQGKLTDISGVGENDTLDIRFRVFDVETGGDSLWAMTVADVPIVHGMFDVNIGPIDLPFDEQYWLEIIVDGNTLAPRVQLTSSPYAFRAAVADSFTGVGGIVNGVLGGAGIVVDSTDRSRPIVSTRLRTGGGLNNTLGTGSDELSLVDGTTDGQVLKWNGTSGEWELRPDNVGSGSVPDGLVEDDMLTWDEMSGAWIAEPLTDAIIPDDISIDNAAISALDGGSDVTVHGVLIADTLTSPLDTLYLPEIVWMDELVTDSIEASSDVVKIRDALWIQDSLYFDGGWRNDWPSGGSDGDWTVSGLNMYSTVAGNVGIGTETMEGRLHVENEIDSIVYESYLYDFEGGTIEPCTTYGAADWYITDEEAFSGTYCARSGVGVGISAQSVLELEVSFASDSIVSFAIKTTVSSGPPLFCFQIDGDVVDSWSSPTAWSVVSYPVSAGSHTFTWSIVTSFTSQGVFYVDSIDFTYGNIVPIGSRALYCSGGNISDAAVFIDGNVGIGTENPAELLDVNGDVNISGNISAATALIGDPGSNGESDAQEASMWAGLGYVETPWVYANNIQASDERGVEGTGIAIGNSHTNFDSTEHDEIALYTSGRSRLFVASDGNIGIGTVTPTEKLDVNGNTHISGDLTVDGSYPTDNDWVVSTAIGDGTEDTTLITGGNWGIFRDGNIGFGNACSTHVNLGVACTTGESGANRKYVTIGGGYGNHAENNTSTIAGGHQNKLSDYYGFIGSGYQNVGTNYCIVIGGGQTNLAAGYSAVVGGGILNKSIGYVATIPGGYANCDSADYSFVFGRDNLLRESADFSVLFGIHDTLAEDSTFYIGLPYTQTQALAVLDSLHFDGAWRTEWPDDDDGDWTIDSDDMYSAVSGNVGIGTTTPSNKMQIEAGADTALFATGTSGTVGYFNNTNTTDNYYGISAICANTPDYGTGGYFEGGGIGLEAQSNLSGDGSRMGIHSEASNGTIWNTGVYGSGTGGTCAFGLFGEASGGSTAYGIYAVASGGATNWAGYFDGDAYFEGDVGIGANNPSAKLTIKNNTDTVSVVNIIGADATTSIETKNIMYLRRSAVSGVKNANTASLAVGAYETGINGGTRLDIRLTGRAGPGNSYGKRPDITAMSLLGSGNVGVGTETPDPSAQMDISSTERGLKIPSMTIDERDSIDSPAIGLIIFNTTYNCIEFFAGCSTWISMCDDDRPSDRGWKQKADFNGDARYRAVGFSIGTKGYIGTGQGSGWITYKDFWEYNPASDTWTQKADFGGTTRYAAVGFSIGTKGYIGTGSSSGFEDDFWEYNPATNTWAEKTSFSGGDRAYACGFSIGTKGYICLGFSGTEMKKDMWEYDPSFDSWTQKTDFPGNARAMAVGFSIGNYGYVGTGADNSDNYFRDFYEYDPAFDSWATKADMDSARAGAVGFSIGTKGYVGLGSDTTIVGYEFRDMWEYDPSGDSWSRKDDFGGTARTNAVGFSIGSLGYIGTGTDNTAIKSDFWEFLP